MTTNYFPPLTDLLDASAIPGDIEFLEGGVQAVIDLLLGKIFYKDLAIDVSSAGDEAVYSLTLVTKSIRQPLFGTGMELVFFRCAMPDGSECPDSQYSEFPIIFNWRWEIKKYISGFEANGFAYTPEAFMEIFFELAGIQDLDEFLEAVLDVFLDNGTGAYLAFFDEITATIQLYDDGADQDIAAEIQNIVGKLLIIRDEVSGLLNRSNLLRLKQIYKDYQNNTVIQPAVESIQTSIETLKTTLDIDIDIYKDVVKAVIGDISDIDEKFEKLLELFKTWLGDITIEDVKKLLVPQFAVELTGINMALEFPRNVLLPMKESGGVWQVNPNGKAAIVFTAGNVAYSTETGFDIGIDEGLEIDLPRCMVPNLELQLEFLDVKLDLSRKYNIAEAIADDRPENFIGAYIREANIILPEKWFKFDEDGSTLKLFADDIIVGTGGLSGTIGLAATSGLDPVLQNNMLLNDGVTTISIIPGADNIPNEGDDVVFGAVAADDGRYVLQGGGALIVQNHKLKRFLSSDGELTYKLGKASGNGQWKIGFNQFYLKFWQNKIQESEIKGSLTVPNFKQCGKTGDLKIDISVFFENDGDFRISAAPEGGLTICLGEEGKVFKIKIEDLEAGKDDEKLYLQVTGELDFSKNPLLSKFLKSSIKVKKLRIYSDGSFEIEGGSIPIPGTVPLHLGPVEVNITNITLGAEKLDKGKYKFIGFDCGVSTGSGGLDLRGDGIKIYFNHDGSDMFLRISGIGINLIIPGSADESSAALIVKGYLSIKEDEYTGAVAFKLPKAKIAGGAAMKMRPKIPAFAIDAFVELATPLPILPPLGIFAFRGLFGLRYIADLPDGATSDPDKMFDFYAEKKANPLNGNLPEKGLHLGKIVTPDERADGFKSSGTPISIGLGASIGTVADAGRAFSIQAFLFLSLPEFFMISGKGNVLGERVSMVSEKEPPFFAYMAITSEYISVGLGAEYLIRPNEGQILELNAEAQMAFFLNDPSAWYIHFGTKEEPNQAKILKKIFNLSAYAYLMLSAEGIETGAGIKFEMHKKYGPARVDVSAYGDVYAKLSFRKPQLGGGIACGGRISASAFGVGFDITLDAYLMLTAPQPFLVKGGAHICLEVNLRVKKWKKCIDLEFKWEFEQDNDLSEIKILDTVPFPVGGYHIGSKNAYKLSYFNTSLPNPADSTLEVVPLDTFIDIQLKKPVDPNCVLAKIGGVNNPPAKNMELVPPKAVEKQVTHRFEIEDISIKVWNRNINSWQNYNPYKALDPNAYLQNVDISALKLGYWQKKGKEYNNLRVLANSPFSYADGMPGDIIPEQMGLTAGTLFCPAKETERHCVTWNERLTYAFDKWHSYRDITFRITKFDGASVPFPNVFNIPVSLRMNNRSALEIILPEKCLEAHFRLFSFAETLKVSFYDLQDTTVEQNGVERNQAEYVLIQELSLTPVDYSAPVKYESSVQTIKKIVIEAVRTDERVINELTNELNELTLLKLEQGGTAYDERIRRLTRNLASLQMMTCGTMPRDEEIKELERLIRILEQDIANLKRRAENIRAKRDEACREVSGAKRILEELLEEKRADLIKRNIFDDNTFPDSPFRGLLDQLRALKEKNRKEFDLARSETIAKVEETLQIDDETCQMLSAQYEEMLKEIKQAEEKLDGLKKQLEILWNESTDRCSTFIHEVCYLTQTEWWYDQSIPSREAIEADHNAFSDAVSKVIAPIWRPDETYAIEIKTNEIINNDAFRQTYYFAFKTAGPIGHFPLKHLPEELKKQHDLDINGIPIDTNSSFSTEPVIPENALKFYIDYDKSYPNPIGNIINQKPLFYNDPDLLIFYTEPSVYHFFNNWPDYDSLGQRFASLKLEVKDPAENLQQPANIPPILTIHPNAVLEWKVDTTPPVKQSIEVINNLRDPRIKDPDFDGTTCWQIGGDPIVPASKNTDIKVENLKPSKLYNVNAFNRYSRDGNIYEEKQVHSYPFQTSRYADLNEQVNSYHLKSFDSEGQLLSSLDAIYNIPYNLNSLGTTFNQLRNVVLRNDVTNNFRADLIQNYPDPLQRLLFGYLKQEPLHAALGTEINLLLNENDEMFGIWVRNPEPFNDPRIPFADMQNSVKLLIDDQPLAVVGPLFSKDNSEFLLLRNGLSQPLSSVKLTFIYLVWNGNAYIQKQTVTTENLIQL